MTFRLRLTILYTILLGLALVVFSATLYILLNNSLVSDIDRVLVSSANEVEKRLADSSAETTLRGVPIVLVDPSPIREFTTPGIYVQVLDKQARIFGRSANLSGEIMPINPDLIQIALGGDAAMTTTNPGSPAEPLRVYTRPWTVSGGTIGVIQVGMSLYSLNLTMRWMLLILLSGIVGTMLIGAIVIWLLTGRALRPLVAIANTAEYIGSSQDLKQRLEVHGPNDEVGRLSRAFNAMIGRLDAAFAAQKHFVADSSHELRTPLTVIRGNLDLLKRDSRPESRSESLAAIEQESVRMGKIVDELMLLAQLDGAQMPQCSPVSLDEVVMQVYNQTRVLTQDKTVKLGHVDAAIIQANHDRMVEALLNLVDNAIKYTPPGGTITIECRSADDAGYPGFATLSVSDTGIGIAAEDVPHIFDRFYRVDKARSRAQGGSGLGLAIVKSIIETYGGRIMVNSVPGQGSTFMLLLPVS